jgi:hypothetical protein
MKHTDLQEIYKSLDGLKSFKPNQEQMAFFWDVIRLKNQIKKELDLLEEVIEPFKLTEEEMNYVRMVQSNQDISEVKKEVQDSAQSKFKSQADASNAKCETEFKKFKTEDIPSGINGDVLIALSNFVDL